MIITEQTKANIFKTISLLLPLKSILWISGLIGAMIFLFVLGILYEGIKTGREILKKRSARPPVKGETYNLSGGKCQKVDSMHPEVVNSSRYAPILSLLRRFFSLAKNIIGIYPLFLNFNYFMALLQIIVFHYFTKKRKPSFHILKALFSFDTRQSMKRRITTES